MTYHKMCISMLYLCNFNTKDRILSIMHQHLYTQKDNYRYIKNHRAIYIKGS